MIATMSEASCFGITSFQEKYHVPGMEYFITLERCRDPVFGRKLESLISSHIGLAFTQSE